MSCVNIQSPGFLIVLWNMPKAIYNEPIKLVVIAIPNMPQKLLFVDSLLVATNAL